MSASNDETECDPACESGETCVDGMCEEDPLGTSQGNMMKIMVGFVFLMGGIM